MSFFQFKFKWAHEFPYTVWQIVDQQSARSFLDDHDARVSRGEQVHRVGHSVAGKEGWTLRHDLEQFAANGVYTDRLWAELQSYRMCPLDETSIEAVHRDVTGMGRRAPAATLACRAANLRRSQNLRAIRVHGGQYLADVRAAFSKTSAISRVAKVLPLRPVPVKRATFQSVTEFVYRCGQSKYVRWGVFEERMKALQGPTAMHVITASSRLRLDYLRPVLCNEVVYSLPLVPQAALTDVANLDNVESAARLLDTSVIAEDGPTFIAFRVLDTNVRSKKIMKESDDARAMKTMDWPIRIQQFVLRRPTVDLYPAEQCLMTIEQDSEIVDILDIAPWPVLRLALRRWDTDNSEEAGCLCLKSSLCIGNVSAADIRDVSALVCLETLFRLGWTVGNPPVTHTASSPKQFKVNDPTREKPYLQCLVSLVAIQDKCGQGIPANATRSVYLSLLDRAFGESELPAAIQDDLADLAADAADAERAEADILAIEDQVVDELESADSAQPSSPKRPARAIRPQQIAKRQRVEDLILDAIVLRPEPLVVGSGVSSSSNSMPAAAILDSVNSETGSAPASAVDLSCETGVAASPAIVAMDVSSADGAAMPALADIAVDEDPAPASPAPHEAPGDVLPAPALAEDGDPDSPGVGERPLPLHLHGSRVRIDPYWGGDARGQFYERIIVDCQCAHHTGPRCRKRRNTGATQTAKFGPFEPYAFLGAWLLAGPRFATRSAHVKFHPSEADVQSYMHTHGRSD